MINYSSRTNKRTMKKDNKILSSHSDTTELPDGTELKISVENYEDRIFPMGDEMKVAVKVEYKKLRGTRHVHYFANHLTEDEMKKEVEHIKEGIKKDPNNYKFQHAPK